MGEEDKEKESEKILDAVHKTINRQILGLATSVAFYNLHQSIAKPNEDPLTVTVGGVKYTGNIQVLKRRFEIEENYWKNFMNFFIGQNPIFFSSDSSSGSAKILLLLDLKALGSQFRKKVHFRVH
jgi:hypothetical protein